MLPEEIRNMVMAEKDKYTAGRLARLAAASSIYYDIAREKIKEKRKNMTQYEKMEILAAIRQSVGQVKREYEEQYLTGEELCRQFGCFTPSWLKTYGCLLPRVQAHVVDADGVEHVTGWVYPRFAIAEMARDNKLRFVAQAPTK